MAGWCLRFLGVLSLAGLGLGAFGVIAGIVLLAGGGSDGFEDLAGAIAIMAGAFLLLIGGGMSVAVHMAYVRWVARHPGAARYFIVMGAVIVVFGVAMATALLVGWLVADGREILAALLLLVSLCGVAMIRGRPTNR